MAPTAGLTCTIAEQAFIPGSAVRTKVSGVNSRWFGCCELRVWPRLCTGYPLMEFARRRKLVEKMQAARNRLFDVVRCDRLGRVVADAAGSPQTNHRARNFLCPD